MKRFQDVESALINCPTSRLERDDLEFLPVVIVEGVEKQTRARTV